MTSNPNPVVAVEAAPVRAVHVLPVLVLVPLVAGAIRWTTPTHLVADLGAWAAIVLVSAGLLGMPLLFWILDHPPVRVSTLVLTGAIAGAIPAALCLGSAVLGLTTRHGWDYVASVLARTATIPWFGSLPWPKFWSLEARGALVGAASAAIYWCLLLAPSHSRHVAQLLAFTTLLTAIGLAAFLP